jgi:hypothetical protein
MLPLNGQLSLVLVGWCWVLRVPWFQVLKLLWPLRLRQAGLAVAVAKVVVVLEAVEVLAAMEVADTSYSPRLTGVPDYSGAPA